MTKILHAIAPYRKALAGAALAGAGVILAEQSGGIDWRAVVKAALGAVVTGAGVYQTTNAAPPAQ